jgi:hypothetical protein
MRLGRVLTVVMRLCWMGRELAIFRVGKFLVERPSGGRSELGTKAECKMLSSLPRALLLLDGMGASIQKESRNCGRLGEAGQS